MNSTLFLSTLGPGISWVKQRRGVETPYHLKSTNSCIILTDLAHEVINLHVYMIQRTRILPTPGKENISYTTEY